MHVEIRLNRRTIANVEKNILKIKRGMLKQAGEILEDAAEEVAQLSDSYVPVETGTLKSSRAIEGVYMRRGQGLYGDTEPLVRISYGGSNDQYNPLRRRMASAYAVPVHERLDVFHPVGQAKFLERAVSESHGLFMDRVSRIRWDMSYE